MSENGNVKFIDSHISVEGNTGGSFGEIIFNRNNMTIDKENDN